MIIKHPEKEGWIKATPEIMAISEAIGKIVLPDNNLVSLLYFYDSNIFTLEQAKNYAYDFIADYFESKRGQYITLKPGKVQEWIEKREEWRRFEAAGKPASPAAADYPIAAAEGIEFGYTTRQMLSWYGQKLQQWVMAAATISANERRALRAVENVTTIEGVAAVLALLV